MKKTKSETKNDPAELVQLWERLELKLDQDGEAASFITRIEDIDSGRLTVECPIRVSGNLDLAVGQHLEVVVNKQNASYLFEAVVASIDYQNENLTILQPVSDYKKTQRRRFVRIDIDGDITFKTFDCSEQNKGMFSVENKGELLNISAGGILLITGKPINEDDLLLLNFWIKNSQRLENIPGIVKRVETSINSETQEREYLTGIEFLSKEKSEKHFHLNLAEYLPSDVNYFNDALQKLVVQFVYKQQVELRTKEKANL